MRKALDREAVRAANRIEDVIPELTGHALSRNGTRELVTICPWHDDHNPSLRVNVEKQLWRCDPCDIGGDVFDFVQRFSGVDFRTALEKLAERAGLQNERPADMGRRRIVDVYDYCDEGGQLLFQTVRYDPKDFKQRQPDGKGGWIWNLNGVRLVLFGLPELKGQEDVAICAGEKDTRAILALGLSATTNPLGEGKGKWRPEYTQQLVAAGVKRVSIFPHNDDAGRIHADAVARSCHAAGLEVRIVVLPDVPSKGDVSDYLAAGHTLADLLALVVDTQLYVPGLANAVAPIALDEAHAIVRRWLGDAYDIMAFDLMLATVAAERLNGDPLWVMFITGSGFTKTETVIAAAGAGALVTSTIASEGALLSGSSTRDKAKDATGGLLRRIGTRGVLVIKDVTTILSMNREARAAVLAALREIYDGRWERNLGSNGGISLRWEGRLAVIGACTTAWDAAHAVISSMGDRFVNFRLDSTKGRMEAGRQSLANIGHENEMRAELQRITAGVINGMQQQAIALTEEENEHILAAANLVTRCRTSVETDFHGEVESAHMPEAPTRFAKQLAQIVRGACAIGMGRGEAMKLAIRCARDSMPPMRLELLRAMAQMGESKMVDIRVAIDKPWHTVKRQLEAMHLLGVLSQRVETPPPTDERTAKLVFWYALAEGIDPRVVGILSPGMSGERGEGKYRDQEESEHTQSTDKSGDGALIADFPPTEPVGRHAAADTAPPAQVPFSHPTAAEPPMGISTTALARHHAGRRGAA